MPGCRLSLRFVKLLLHQIPSKIVASSEFATYVLFFLFNIHTTDMLAELTRREKATNIKPDPDIDIFMKVII